ncbi:hypothetical protein [Synechococcus sp. PCC 6312]|uniref:hypothetical protein n=1 Tax=Synechococcus sp. (strain ATCC 27167 / PCC 6312) TaxID=195253 RepID=UPI00029F19F5|nr:hypothetical protein [Synechococcus sp. PCC 6312]AFY60252.1 hypothetical protein Syn6312_1058 [Synechococcus sp. PCC 6312]
MTDSILNSPLDRANYLADLAVERAKSAGEAIPSVKIEVWLSTEEYQDLVANLGQLDWGDFIPGKSIFPALHPETQAMAE